MDTHRPLPKALGQALQHFQALPRPGGGKQAQARLPFCLLGQAVRLCHKGFLQGKGQAVGQPRFPAGCGL